MASEIKVVGGTGEEGEQSVLFFYVIPLNKRITNQTTSAVVVPFPSSEIDPDDDYLFTAAEKTLLDAGEATVVGVVTGAMTLADIQKVYDDGAALALAEYTAKYTYAGKQFDAS